MVSPGNQPASSTNKNDDKNAPSVEEPSFGFVYVNERGREAMAADPPVQFPSGSVIVRERLAAYDATQPDHLMVMVKRERGFNPKANDWEFLSIDGAMTKVEERQKTGSCLDCHASQASRDFVYQVNGLRRH